MKWVRETRSFRGSPDYTVPFFKTYDTFDMKKISEKNGLRIDCAEDSKEVVMLSMLSGGCPLLNQT